MLFPYTLKSAVERERRTRMVREAIDSIVNADAGKAAQVAKDALAAGISPGEIMNDGFIAGITEVGEMFESGEIFLPELMLSAQAMDAATRICNDALAGDGETKGKIVIGTVQGDVHDIGKAIVIAYLKAHAYEVYDVGRDAPTDTFISMAEKTGAQVIGMSALLTTTMREQKKLIKTLQERGLRNQFKVVIGGAPATQRWADQIGADAYAEDANDGVRKIDVLVSSVQTDA
jgi:trimethylamine corrinoid protein